MDILSDDVLMGIASTLLNPSEERFLASCNRRLRRVLPPPLRIQIISWHNESSLGGDLFVSPEQAPQKTLLATDVLNSKQRYYFWKFDYDEGCRVYLGRHLRQTLGESAAASNNNNAAAAPMKYRYCLGFRPKHPNQSWKITPNTDSSSSSSLQDDSTIPFGTNVRLTVCGKDSRSGQPDSTEEQALSAKAIETANNNNNNTVRNNHHDVAPAQTNATTTTTSGWYVADKVVGSIDEQFQILPSNIPLTRTVPIHPVSTYSIPDITDKGAYLYYSPNAWKHVPYSDGRSAIIEFHFWIQKGYMYFQTQLLPFRLGIPIMKLDRSFFQPHLGAVANLFESYSARWGCIKYFMATAADVGEGCALNMASFLRGVTDHEEHKVVHQDNVVFIDMQDEVDTEVPDVPLDTSKVYRFFFSW